MWCSEGRIRPSESWALRFGGNHVQWALAKQGAKWPGTLPASELKNNHSFSLLLLHALKYFLSWRPLLKCNTPGSGHTLSYQQTRGGELHTAQEKTGLRRNAWRWRGGWARGRKVNQSTHLLTLWATDSFTYSLGLTVETPDPGHCHSANKIDDGSWVAQPFQYNLPSYLGSNLNKPGGGDKKIPNTVENYWLFIPNTFRPSPKGVQTREASLPQNREYMF